MYGVYYHFNNLRFGKSQSVNDWSAAATHVVILFVSSEILNCRFLKLLLDHPMSDPGVCETNYSFYVSLCPAILQQTLLSSL